MDNSALRIWGLRLTYLGLVALILFFQTLPLQTAPRIFAAPDFILLITFVWVVRRPDIIRPFLVVFALLFADFILQRPPGLWTLIVLIATTVLRSRASELLENVFPVEWITAAVLMVFSAAAYQIALLITFLPTDNLLIVTLQIAPTIVLYPVITFLSRKLFGVARMTRAEFEAKVIP